MKINILKFEKVIFYLILLFLPTQLGKHFWPDFSMVDGIRVDYLSPTIYVTDVFIILLFIFFCLNHRETIKKVFSIKYLVLSIFLLIGIIFSKSPALGFYGFLKLIEFGFFGFYTANYLRGASFCFVIGIIFESLLGIAHYLNQGSIGGVMYFFGEREFNQSTPGIANASINGELVLRPYGTFSHPNVLAGYLTIVMAIVISNFNPFDRLRVDAERSRSIKFPISNFKKIIFTISIILGTLALFLTMSRVAILLWIAFLFVKIYSMFKYKSISLLALITFLAIILLSPLSQRFISINPMDESVQLRKELIQTSLAMIEHNPLFGVGLNNFLVNTTSYLQPVHNIYLLIAAQTGIVGLLIFLWFIGKTYKRIMNNESLRPELRARAGIKNNKSIIHNSRLAAKRAKFIILSMVLILGLFDHYFLTLQQGQLLFSFILGFCWRDRQHI